MAIDFSPGGARQDGLWLGDFRYERGRIFVKSTGVWMKSDLQLWADIARWLTYYAFVRGKGLAVRLGRGPRARIWFAPYRPRPWYIMWAAMVWGGLDFASSPEHADAAVYFEDVTQAIPPPPRHARHFNFGVGDVSKSRVAAVMEQAFGYPLALDPTTHSGVAVEKSEGNGLHDGRIVACPSARQPGKAYQLLIETEGDDGWAYDLRTVTIGRRPVVVFVKKKPAAARFSIQNTAVEVRLPEAVFSAAELEQIEHFCALMHLDWGGVDILRERKSGRLYIVDVNKTDTGPAVVLSWKDRARATQLLADALTRMVAPVSASSPPRQ